MPKEKITNRQKNISRVLREKQKVVKYKINSFAIPKSGIIQAECTRSLSAGQENVSRFTADVKKK
jgi:hypothetical protein